MKVQNLRTEYKNNPLGIDTQKPRLSWETYSKERDWEQSAYRIVCALSEAELETQVNLLWDSGKVISDKSVHIEYEGIELLPGQKVFWKVNVWDKTDKESLFSEVACWQMGLLSNDNWKANWIEPELKEEVSDSTPSPYLRKVFQVKPDLQQATVYVSCKGLYEFSLNGEKFNNDLFTPGWTSYHHRIQYQTYDITEQLEVGRNCAGIILGDGWYRGFLVWQGNKNLYGDKLALLFQLELQYKDGSKEIVCSDTNWKSSTGPILKSDIYNGETYDARLDMDGWNTVDFNADAWSNVNELKEGYEKIVPSEGVPVQITEAIEPVENIVTPKNEIVYDFGQNLVGWVEIKVKGNAGNKITLNHAEVLDQDGNFYTENLREAKCEDIYVLKGGEPEVYQPRFTFHGFRYVRISGCEENMRIVSIKAKVVHSAMSPIGDFECSDPFINRLQKNIQWGLRGNFLDVPTDCPQRDERLGWTGDAQVFAPTACFNMDASSFYRKWMKDYPVDQKKDGSVPWVVPNVVGTDGGGTGWSDGYGATGWSDAAVIIPWEVYKAYGDIRILEEQYESMKAWEEYMINVSPDGIFSHGFHFGDWLAFAEYYSYKYNAPDYGYAGAYTEKELIATAYFYYTTGLMEKIATLLNDNEEAVRYNVLQGKIKEAFCDEFLTKTGRLTSNSQTAYTLALSFGLLPESMVPIAAKRLADDVNHFEHLTTGFLGTPLLCQSLTENGYADIAFKLLFNKRYPSWLYPVTMGATTIWERWDCIKPDGTFQTAGMNSFNHYAYGAVGAWLYGYVAGLRIDEENPGYKHCIIEPYLTKELDFAKAVHHSVYGLIVSYWERKKGTINLRITIPANTSAEVHIPCENIDGILLDETPVTTNQDVELIGAKENRTILNVGSGEYIFSFAE